ncbi:cyanobactin biosynthesis PatC/TenC/TruC family protein [Sphaerospermopsis sp. LEGE 00249]|nr:cyanobactin biosynthesis PatC/TenC/TruC family protein [Sphaerospermopsis sp. LEGE 00249]
MYVLGIIKIMSIPKKTPANSSQPEPQLPAEIERKLLSTGLEDYGFWSQEMARQKAQQTEPDKPFRRGRIWC